MNTFCPYNRIIVNVGKEYSDEVISSSGIKFYQDTSYRPEWHVAISGIVFSPPKKVTTEIENYSNIKNILKKGDKIYFKYHQIDEDNVVFVDKVKHYLIDYEGVFCVIRGGNIIMISDWNLIEPCKKEFPPVVADGRTEKEKEIRLKILNEERIKEEIRYNKTTGILRHKEDNCIWEKGDLLRFSQNLSFLNTIEGKEYYCIRTKGLLCRILSE